MVARLGAAVVARLGAVVVARLRAVADARLEAKADVTQVASRPEMAAVPRVAGRPRAAARSPGAVDAGGGPAAGSSPLWGGIVTGAVPPRCARGAYDARQRGGRAYARSSACCCRPVATTTYCRPLSW